MWELDYEKSWALKNWYFWTVVLEKTLESPLDCKEIQPVHPNGNQSWVFIGRTDVEAEIPILWPLDVKNWLIWKTLMLGKIEASLTQWTWVWVGSRSWWWIGRPGMLQFMGLQRVGHDWVTELKWMGQSQTETINISDTLNLECYFTLDEHCLYFLYFFFTFCPYFISSHFLVFLFPLHPLYNNDLPFRLMNVASSN